MLGGKHTALEEEEEIRNKVGGQSKNMGTLETTEKGRRKRDMEEIKEQNNNNKRTRNNVHSQIKMRTTKKKENKIKNKKRKK